MRIISGLKKGHIIKAPNNLPTRPTTDRSKESLFNILQNWYDIDECNILDLYAGTGNITYEFASRGAKSVTCIDRFKGCTDFITSECYKLDFVQVNVLNMDVLHFLEHCKDKFHIIFADPPFATKDYEKIHSLVYASDLLESNGSFIMEHHSVHNFSGLAHFDEARHYGQNVMSFYSAPGAEGQVMQSFVHYFLHFGFPLIVALTLYRKQWKKAYILLLATMLVDLDHLLADPIFDPQRCGIGFHPLHSFYAIPIYFVMLFFKGHIRIIGLGLVLHMCTDLIDCLFIYGQCHSCLQDAPALPLVKALTTFLGIG